VDGHEYRVDFWFPEQGVIIEIDGRAKYEQARYLNGRSAAEVFIDEKRRHERLLSVDGVRQVIRLEWRDLFDRRTLVLRLRKTGIPCRAVDELSACSLLVA
jgi:very-short-patch-repair endonuclease